MKNKQKNFLIIGIGFLILFFIVGYFYKTGNFINNKEIKFNNYKKTQKIKGNQEPKDGFQKPLSVKVLPIKSLKSLTPNLNKKIIFNKSISKKNREFITGKINKLIIDLKKNSNDSNAWIDLGSYRKMIGDYKGAEEAWNYASVLTPKSVVPFNNLGDLYHFYLKDYPKSERNFEKAIKNNPKYLASYINLFQLYQLSYKQNTDKAVKILQQALKQSPNNIAILTTLAGYFEDKDNTEKAVSYFNRALVQSEKNNDISLSNEIKKKLLILKNK